jgi:hypothetical protein
MKYTSSISNLAQKNFRFTVPITEGIRLFGSKLYFSFQNFEAMQSGGLIKICDVIEVYSYFEFLLS